MQKRASAGRSAPQDGQTAGNVPPQCMQKRAPIGLSLVQLLQTIPAIANPRYRAISGFSRRYATRDERCGARAGCDYQAWPLPHCGQCTTVETEAAKTSPQWQW